MSCPEGQYFCNDKQKCMPIPKGNKVRKDGELVKEVAPPGWGHTKAKKEKTNPEKPKSKIGGSAAAFKRALDDGRFKGLPGDKTKKEKTASMFKLMWSMKKKGAKPHYKPGTDKKYEKYQEDWKPEIEHSKLGDAVKKKAEKKRKAAADSLPPHLRLDVMKKAFAHTNEEVEVEEGSAYGLWKGDGKVKLPGTKGRHPRDQKELDKAQAYIKKNPNFGKKKKAVGEEVEVVDEMKVSKIKDGKGGAEKIIDAMVSAAKRDREARANRRERKRPKAPYQMLAQEYIPEKTTMKDNNLFGDAYAGSYEKLKKKIGSKKMHNKPAIEENKFVKAMVDAVKRKKEEKKPEKAQDAGARLRRKKAREEYADKVSGSVDLVPDDLRDHKNWSDFKKHI